MVELADIHPRDTMADLGSGDGRILIAFAKHGIQCEGYELDENLVEKSKKAIRDERVEQRIQIHTMNFWEVNLSKYTILTVYGMPDIMKKLEVKLREELQPGSRILLNYYPFPDWKYETMKNNVYLYKVTK